MQYLLSSKKEIVSLGIALLAAVVTSVLNFQEGPSNAWLILATPIFIALILIAISFPFRFRGEEIVQVLKRYAVLLFLSLFVTIPYFIWYFLGQDEYGAMVLIMGIINIDLVTVLQVITVLGIAFLTRQFLVRGEKFS